MTLKLSDLVEVLKDLDVKEVPSHFCVSPAIWEQILNTKQDQVDLNKLIGGGIRIELAPYYRPDWWSEHYRDRIVFHTEQGTRAIPSVRFFHTIRPTFKPFEIRSNMKEKTLGQIGYEAYCKFTDNKGLITGADLPAFENLKTPIQEAWEKAGQAVAASVGRADTFTGTVSEPGKVAPGEPEIGQSQK